MGKLEIDFHVHSKYSPDSLTPQSWILKFAKRRGLSGIAVTDHNTIKGGIVTHKLNRSDDFIVIIGSEIKTDKGDLIGIFLNEEIKKRRFFEVCDEIKDQDGLIVLPHPFLTFKSISEDLLKAIDVIEALNARGPYEINEKALNLALKKSLPILAGSDAHYPWHVGNARTFLECNLEYEDIKKCILQRNVKVKGETLPFINHIFYRHLAGKAIKKLKDIWRAQK